MWFPLHYYPGQGRLPYTGVTNDLILVGVMDYRGISLLRSKHARDQEPIHLRQVQLRPSDASRYLT